MTVPNNGLLKGFGYSMVFPYMEEIIPPATANAIKAINKLTDHFPAGVLGRNVIFMKYTFFHNVLLI